MLQARPSAWLWALLLLPWGLAGCGQEDEIEAAPRPDIVLIVVDTLRHDHVGFRGARLADGESSPTPALDALARRAIGPTSALTPVPLTLPAHTSMFSGLWPDRHGVRENDSFALPAREERGFPVLAEILREEGYRTAGFVSGQPLERRFGVAAGFRSWSQPDPESPSADELRFREKTAPQTTADVLAWLRATSAAEGPRFLFVHYFDPHDPYLRPVEHPALPKGRGGDYLSEILHVDRSIGRLLQALESEGRDPWIVVTADHGEGLGEHGEATHGLLVHDATVRVPYLLVPPTKLRAQAAAEVESSLPARHVDLLPTLLDAAGLSRRIPAGLDGRSLLQGPAGEEWRHYAESLYPWFQFRFAQPRVWRDAQTKLIEDGAVREAFAWREDPGEEHPLSAPAGEALARQLRAITPLRQRGAAREVQVQASETSLYMGHRPPGPLEPDRKTNAKLPRVADRWKVLAALDEARRLLSRSQLRAAEAILVLEDPEVSAESDRNPSLLFWTARAHEKLGAGESATRVPRGARRRALDRAIALYAQHHRSFRDPRSRDSGLVARLHRARLMQDRQGYRRIVEIVTGERAAQRATALAEGIAARAHEALGEGKAALEAIERAHALDPRDPLIAADLERLRRDHRDR